MLLGTGEGEGQAQGWASGARAGARMEPVGPIGDPIPPHTCPVHPCSFVLLTKDSPCILAAAITSPAEMLDTLTR